MNVKHVDTLFPSSLHLPKRTICTVCRLEFHANHVCHAFQGPWHLPDCTAFLWKKRRSSPPRSELYECPQPGHAEPQRVRGFPARRQKNRACGNMPQALQRLPDKYPGSRRPDCLSGPFQAGPPESSRRNPERPLRRAPQHSHDSWPAVPRRGASHPGRPVRTHTAEHSRTAVSSS